MEKLHDGVPTAEWGVSRLGWLEAACIDLQIELIPPVLATCTATAAAAAGIVVCQHD